MAVKKAVSAATMTFTAISIIRFFIFSNLQFSALASHWGLALPHRLSLGFRRCIASHWGLELTQVIQTKAPAANDPTLSPLAAQTIPRDNFLNVLPPCPFVPLVIHSP